MKIAGTTFSIKHFQLGFLIRSNVLKVDLGWVGFLIERPFYCEDCKVIHKPSEEWFGGVPTFPLPIGMTPVELADMLSKSPAELLTQLKEDIARTEEKMQSELTPEALATPFVERVKGNENIH